MEIRFEGWFQCRLATNPDPTNEPRGISGYTFALAGEPDLDRVIRFQDPNAARSHGPPVGVNVVAVETNGEDRVGHPLIGASVNLLHGPRFESRNVILSDDRGGVGVIHPFVIKISGAGITLQREDILYREQPALPIYRIPPLELNRRAAVELDGMVFDSARVAASLGIENAGAYRARRCKLLEQDRRTAADSIATAALDKRIRELSIIEPNNIRTVVLNVIQDRRFDLNGPAEVIDNGNALGTVCDTSLDWPIKFWMGAWDADALCGFVQGSLSIPSFLGSHQ